MDKNKILDAATKHVAKGAYDKAIREYQKLLDADPKDVRILHKLGELYEKKNDSVQAASFFTRVADSYAADGFSMKAIALFKKVLKLDPSLIDVNVKLAELHQQHQLMSEAMAYYQAVANHYDSRGDIEASLDILKRMVELEPDNVASRIKLADLYAREGRGPQAAEEYRRASEHLRRTGRIDDYLRVGERLWALRPEDVELARDLAQEYLGRGDQKRALAKLQVCFKADPREVQTLTLLAKAFEGLGQLGKTLSVYKELARIHTEAGHADDASRVWAKVAQIDPMDPDFRARNAANRAQAQPRAQPAPAASPASDSAPAPSVAKPVGQPGQAGQAAAGGLSRDGLAKLLTETDVYVKYGLHDKALEHLRRVFTVDPENLDAHEKAYQIYVAANNPGAAAEQLLNVLRLCTRREEVARAQPYLAQILQTNPHHAEVPAFLAVLRTADTALPPPPSEEEPLPEDAILVDASEEEIIVADEPPDALVEDDLALAHAQLPDAEGEDEALVHDPALAEDEPLLPYPAGEDEPLLYGTGGDDDEVIAEPVLDAMPLGDPEGHEATTRAHPLSPELAALAADSTRPWPAHAEPADPSSSSSSPSVEDGQEVYELGDDDPALLTTAAYEALTREQLRGDVPENPWDGVPVEGQAAEADAEGEDPWERTSRIAPEDAAALLAAEAAVEPPAPSETPWASDGTVLEAAPPGDVYAEETPVEAPPEDEPAAEECDEAAFFLEQGLLDEARDIIETVLIAFPGHARALSLQERLHHAESQAGDAGADAWATDAYATGADAGWDAGAQDGGSGTQSFDLAAELEGELDGADAAPLPALDDYQVSVEEVFSEFKRGLEKIVKPEDVETHYDLGIAYKEMGLLDDAIGEFQVAQQGCVGKKKEIDCLTMIGLLQMMKGDPMSAVEAFKQALRSGGQVTADTARSLRVELATAWESAGSPGRALYHLQRVAAEAPDYRDVAHNVQRLAQLAAPELDEDGLDDPGGQPAQAAASAGDPGNAAASGARTGKVGYI